MMKNKKLTKRRIMLFLNGLICALIPIIFVVLLLFALSSCSTAVMVKPQIEKPSVSKNEISELSGLLIEEPETQEDLMVNLYVMEGLLNIYIDYADALEGYIEDISLNVVE